MKDIKLQFASLAGALLEMLCASLCLESKGHPLGGGGGGGASTALGSLV